MAFDVEISPRAFRDLDELATELKERSQSYAVARKWFLSSRDKKVDRPEWIDLRQGTHRFDTVIRRRRLGL
jgi:hypothetical protein